MSFKKKFLSTGQLAELYSVTPDAVLKWIKEGKISAIRTPGGHFRINMDDILSDTKETGDQLEIDKCDLLSPYCWQFNAKQGKLLEGCSRCIVYKLRAKRCYLVNELPQEVGHARQFCITTCEECEYFKVWAKSGHSMNHEV